jgi:hypothetical protein
MILNSNLNVTLSLWSQVGENALHVPVFLSMIVGLVIPVFANAAMELVLTAKVYIRL